MRRRVFMMCTGVVLATFGLVLAGCAGTSARTASIPSSSEDKRQTINAGADSTLERLYSNVNGARELVSKAVGVLVFPAVIAAGFSMGGEYGEGALRVGGSPVGYYGMDGGSFGLLTGPRSKALVFLFMTQDALDKFRNSEGWTVGADATVAVVKVGANDEIETSTAAGPVQAFVLDKAGLMAGVSLEGIRVTRLGL